MDLRIPEAQYLRIPESENLEISESQNLRIAESQFRKNYNGSDPNLS